MSVRIATFNCNNLFSRWNFQTELPDATTPAGTAGVLRGEAPAVAELAGTEAEPAGAPLVVTVEVGGATLTGVLRTFQGRLVRGKDVKARVWIARRIAALDADVLAVQEVEDQDALDAFDRDELAPLGSAYPYRVVVEGNDPRRIDVGVLSRLPLGRVSSWRFRPDPADPARPVFSRDLLQVELLTPGRPVHLLVNHLKSNYIPDEFRLSIAERQAARQAITARRRRQSEAIAAILRQQRLTRRIVVVGDMNDNPTSECMAPLSETELTEHVTTAATLPGPTRTGKLVADKFADRSPTAWTHRFKTPAVTEYGLYDQIWTSSDLNPTVAASWIMRRTQITGDGSDHDPAAIDLDV